MLKLKNGNIKINYFNLLFTSGKSRLSKWNLLNSKIQIYFTNAQLMTQRRTPSQKKAYQQVSTSAARTHLRSLFAGKMPGRWRQ